jgi:hypothetical protein
MNSKWTFVIVGLFLVTILMGTCSVPTTAVTLVPDLFLPQLRTHSSSFFMEALLQDKLTEKEGCLRVSSSNEVPVS